jgi:hypothetical protein
MPMRVSLPSGISTAPAIYEFIATTTVLLHLSVWHHLAHNLQNLSVTPKFFELIRNTSGQPPSIVKFENQIRVYEEMTVSGVERPRMRFTERQIHFYRVTS